MSAQHTPGPWLVGGPTIFAAPTDAAPTGYPLAHVLNPYSGSVGSADRVNANARLIAAAPEQHAELQKVARFLADLNGCAWITGTDPACIDMRQRAKALQLSVFSAIAKATGGEA